MSSRHILDLNDFSQCIYKSLKNEPQVRGVYFITFEVTEPIKQGDEDVRFLEANLCKNKDPNLVQYHEILRYPPSEKVNKEEVIEGLALKVQRSLASFNPSVETIFERTDKKYNDFPHLEFAEYQLPKEKNVSPEEAKKMFQNLRAQLALL